MPPNAKVIALQYLKGADQDEREKFSSVYSIQSVHHMTQFSYISSNCN